MPGVFEALRRAGELGFTVHVVSKCGQNVQRKTLEWLAHHNFYERTGVDPGRVLFCRTRPGKRPILPQPQKITHLWDDRLDVLEYLSDVRELFLFQPNEADASRWRSSGHPFAAGYGLVGGASTNCGGTFSVSQTPLAEQ